VTGIRGTDSGRRFAAHPPGAGVGAAVADGAAFDAAVEREPRGIRFLGVAKRARLAYLLRQARRVIAGWEARMDSRSFRFRWGWLAVLTVLTALAGAWLSADAEAAEPLPAVGQP